MPLTNMPLTNKKRLKKQKKNLKLIIYHKMCMYYLFIYHLAKYNSSVIELIQKKKEKKKYYGIG